MKLSRLREHLGTAGLVVAIVALVAALAGGAIAANGGSGDGKATASAKRKGAARAAAPARKTAAKRPGTTGRGAGGARTRNKPMRGGTGRESELDQTPQTGRSVVGPTNPMKTKRSTGTPAGVGGFRVPPVYLAPGDVVTVGIDVIGELTNHVVAPDQPGRLA